MNNLFGWVRDIAITTAMPYILRDKKDEEGPDFSSLSLDGKIIWVVSAIFFALIILIAVTAQCAWDKAVGNRLRYRRRMSSTVRQGCGCR